MEILGVKIQCWSLSKRKTEISQTVPISLRKFTKKRKNALIKPVVYNLWNVSNGMVCTISFFNQNLKAFRVNGKRPWFPTDMVPQFPWKPNPSFPLTSQKSCDSEDDLCHVAFFPLCVSALENHLLTKGSHFLVASYTPTLLQVYFEPATLLNRAATTPGTSCPTHFDKCAGSLTSHGILELKELWDGTSSL